MLLIEFINNTNHDTTKWEKLARQLLVSGQKILQIKHQINLAITFVNTDQALKINQQYRQQNYIPDVTSFPAEMSKQEIEALGYQEIGDIFICIDEATNKSIKYMHTLQEEMAFLFVHGFLHLLGYDHEISEQQEQEMFAWQTEILQANKIEYIIKFNEEDYVQEGL